MIDWRLRQSYLEKRYKIRIVEFTHLDRWQNRTLHCTSREQVERADDCCDLPEALIHPDPVMKNLILTPKNEHVLIDWTGAGGRPRLTSVAALIWSGALINGGWSLQNVD